MDKDFLVLFSEMLRKQDVQAGILQNLIEEVKGSNENMLSFFTDQREFNKNAVVSFIDQREFNKNAVVSFIDQREFNKNVLVSFGEQREFNKQFLSEIRDIKTLLSALAQLDNRLNAIEARENNFEERLAKLENLQRAS